MGIVKDYKILGPNKGFFTVHKGTDSPMLIQYNGLCRVQNLDI